MRDVRRRRRRRAADRRRVARDVGVTPAEGVGLHAAGVVRPREPRALVDVTQRRRPRRRGVVLVVRRDVQPEVTRVDRVRRRSPSAASRRPDRGRQVGERNLDLEVVAAGGAVAVVDGRVVAPDPRRRRDDLDAGRVRGVVDRRRERPGRVALVVVGVTLPAGPVDAVAVEVRRVVREREDAELEGRAGVEVRLRRVAPRVDQDLDRVGEPVRDTFLRRDGVALEVVADVDEDVEVVTVDGDLP